MGEHFSASKVAGKAPFLPQHWIPWLGVWEMSWSINCPICITRIVLSLSASLAPTDRALLTVRADGSSKLSWVLFLGRSSVPFGHDIQCCHASHHHTGGGQHQPPHQLPGGVEFSPAQYSFEYGVRDGEVGVNYGQQETRAGTVTTGSYSVALPDGRIEKVHYTVDPVGGYEAVVTYEGGAEEQPQQQAGYPQYSVLG